MNILYVEDDPLDSELVKREFARHAPQHTVKVVTTYRAALAALESSAEFDLILADYHLPDGDGLGLLARVRARALPFAVVIVTGAGDEEAAVAMMKAGADDYVVKRGDYAARLPAILEDALAHYRAQAVYGTRPLRVLYAEHNPTDIDLTRRHLAAHAPHIHLDTVNTASETLQRLSAPTLQDEYDVILVDYRLPGMNALEMLKELRQVRGVDIPIVLVTSAGSDEIALQALKLGAADYLVKHEGYLHRLPAALENAFHQNQLRREQIALREKSEELDRFFTSALDLLCVADTDGYFRRVNPEWAKTLGYPLAELEGARFLDFVHPEDQASTLAAMGDLAQQKEVLDFVNRYRRKDGTYRWIEWRAYPAGKLIYAAARDITARLRAEETLRASEERYRKLIETSPDGIAIVGLDGRLSYVSPKILEIYGYQNESEIIGHMTVEWVAPEDREAAITNITNLFRGILSTHNRYQMVRKDGSRFWGETNSAVLTDAQGKPSGLLSIIRDVTDQVRAEEALSLIHI